MQAAVGCAQLKKIDSFTSRRRENFSSLYDGLSDLSDKLILPKACPSSAPSWFGFLITCKEPGLKNKIVKHLEDNGIQTRMLFGGNMLKQPCFAEMKASGEGYRVIGDLPVTDRIMEDTFWIGVYPGMTAPMIDKMVRVIHEAVVN